MEYLRFNFRDQLIRYRKFPDGGGVHIFLANSLSAGTTKIVRVFARNEKFLRLQGTRAMETVEAS